MAFKKQASRVGEAFFVIFEKMGQSQFFLLNSISHLPLHSQNLPARPIGRAGKQGSLAQLVQSICLTSRGSGVRIPQLPQ